MRDGDAIAVDMNSLCWELLECRDLSDDQIVSFCENPLETLDSVNESQRERECPEERRYRQDIADYNRRRNEFLDLKEDLSNGKARVNPDSGLLELIPNPAEIPPLAGLAAAAAAVAPPGADGRDPEELDRAWVRQQEIASLAVVNRARRRYREEGVADDDLELVLVRPMENHDRARLTIRRILVAVFTVTTAFMCLVIQTLPLLKGWIFVSNRSNAQNDRESSTSDPLLQSLLEIKPLLEHIRQCPGLDRGTEYLPNNEAKSQVSSLQSSRWAQSLFVHFRHYIQYPLLKHQKAYTPAESMIDCSQGVVHITDLKYLKSYRSYVNSILSSYLNSYPSSKSVQDLESLQPFLKSGIDKSWFFPCADSSPYSPDSSTEGTCQHGTVGYCPSESSHSGTSFWNSKTRRKPKEERVCFRGVHDEFLTDREVNEALRLGKHLVSSRGFDHFDVHFDTSVLTGQLDGVVTKLRALLREQYGLIDDAGESGTTHNRSWWIFSSSTDDTAEKVSVPNHRLTPVAFRVSAAAPLDGTGVPRFASPISNGLLHLLNRFNYGRWVENAAARTEWVKYSASLPWPFRIATPERDPCRLMADMDADPRFQIHTTVFLSDGAGQDYRGGTLLYVDDHPSNSNPRQKIQRGIAIDGARGRLVVSTGGTENRRCRLPVRTGIRVALQIWWQWTPVNV
jgi:hypothetical protein